MGRISSPHRTECCVEQSGRPMAEVHAAKGMRAHTTRARARRALVWCAAVVILLGSGCGGASGSGAVQDGAADRSTADSSATNAPLNEESLRQNALAALQGVEAWQVEVVGEGGYRTTEWWSCNSSMYRWDDASGGVTISKCNGRLGARHDSE